MFDKTINYDGIIRKIKQPKKDEMLIISLENVSPAQIEKLQLKLKETIGFSFANKILITNVPIEIIKIKK